MKQRKSIIASLAWPMLFISLLAIEASAQSFPFESSPSQTQMFFYASDSMKTTVKSPTGAMIRSLVVPGWGQWYNNKKLKAFVVFGTEVGLLVNSIYLNQKYREWDRKFRASEPGFAQNVIIANREFYINNRNTSTWWLVGVALFSMADAFVDAHLFNFDESSDLACLNISPIGDAHATEIRLSCCFRF